MKNVPITHLFGLDSFELKHYANILAEFADNGAKYISLPNGILKKLCYEPAFCCQLYSIFQNSTVKPFECHGLWAAADMT